MEQAQFFIYDFLDAHGIDTERISDTGTVENIVDRGYSVEDVANGKVPSLVILDNISWLW